MAGPEREARIRKAAERTDLAEDRTVLASERTYASWIRTSMAAVAVGLGFRALLRSFEPVWIVQAIATVFILAGVVMLWLAYHRAAQVLDRLQNHEVTTMSRSRMLWISGLLTLASVALAIVLWMLA